MRNLHEHGSESPGELLTHARWHTHPPLVHEHAHTPDLHHRHPHQRISLAIFELRKPSIWLDRQNDARISFLYAARAPDFSYRPHQLCLICRFDENNGIGWTSQDVNGLYAGNGMQRIMECANICKTAGYTDLQENERRHHLFPPCLS
jgi:hypothetical protein